MSWLAEYYLWFKALHIISVIAWMAGLLYLPRLFVYHSAMEVTSEQSKTFKIMERRLLKFIMHPAMIFVLVFGFLLIITPGFVNWSEWWLYAKLILVIGIEFLSVLEIKIVCISLMSYVFLILEINNIILYVNLFLLLFSSAVVIDEIEV